MANDTAAQDAWDVVRDLSALLAWLRAEPRPPGGLTFGEAAHAVERAIGIIASNEAARPRAETAGGAPGGSSHKRLRVWERGGYRGDAQAMAVFASTDAKEAADALDAKDAEIAALRHDIERHVRIASEQAEEIERLRALLRDALEHLTPGDYEGEGRLCERIRAALGEEG